MPVEPGPDLRVLMAAVVVEDDVDDLTDRTSVATAFTG
jgi:hypothetical protein